MATVCVCVCVCARCAQCAKRPPSRRLRRCLVQTTLHCIALHSSRSALLHRRHSSVYYLRHRTPTDHKLTASVRLSVYSSVFASVSVSGFVRQALCTAQRFSIIFGDWAAGRRAPCHCDMILMCAIV